MTALTPQQMRALAARAVQSDDGHAYSVPARDLIEYNAALRAAADRLAAVHATVVRYAGWHEESPEDSWRFERDIRTALGMEQYSGDTDD